jgi:hypothetical protein
LVTLKNGGVTPLCRCARIAMGDLTPVRRVLNGATSRPW